MAFLKMPCTLLVLYLNSIGLVNGAVECSRSYYGFDYRGKVSNTSGGFTCQSWSSQSPHPHNFTEGYMFPDRNVDEAENFCRNPNERIRGPWCYTADPDQEWDYCDIPRCSTYPECRITESGAEYRGNIAVTQTGIPCANWNDRLEDSGLDLNLCRNPDDRAAPWCYLQGDDEEAWDYCDVPFCKPAMHCIPESADYSVFVGTLSVTETGRMCQRWASQTPNEHDYNIDALFPDGGVEEANNYCRNPDGDSDGVWCFTTDPEVPWEYCNLPRCESDCKISTAGRDYTGIKSSTVSGLECQRWDSQSPHPHNMTSSDRFPDANSSKAENFCRNPDGKEGGPWCYTASEETEWDYCGIPDCPYDTDDYPRSPRARHVLHIGIDGLHPKCLDNATFGAPNMVNRLVQQGTYTYTRARTSLSTVSGPGWSTILCGQGVETSGVTGNSWEPVWKGSEEAISPVNGDSWPFPTVFEALKSQDASIRTAFYYDWAWLRHMANSGVPGSVDNDHHCSPVVELYPICDQIMARNASEYIRQIVKAAERTYTFVYLGNLDIFGHTFTWCSTLYGVAVSYSDLQVGYLLDAVDEVGSDDFLVMLSTDHGGFEFDHGRQADSDIRVPLFMRGPGVPANEEFPYVVQTRDMVPTAADFLGLRQNPWWTGRSLKEAYHPRSTSKSRTRKSRN